MKSDCTPSAAVTLFAVLLSNGAAVFVCFVAIGSRICFGITHNVSQERCRLSVDHFIKPLVSEITLQLPKSGIFL
jgi:hypothetical protein